MQSEATVRLGVFSGENLVVLLESGRVLVFNGTTQTWGNSSVLNVSTSLSQVGLHNLATHRKCFDGAHFKIMMSIVVGWSNKLQSNGSTIYFSKDSGISFQQLYFPTLNFTFISVQDVEIHCVFPTATFLLIATDYDNQQEMMFLEYNFADNVWVEKEFKLPSINQDLPTSFSFIPPSTQFVISWSKKMFMFGELNETGSVFKLKKQDNLTDFMLNDNETIVSVIPGGHGHFVVQLSNNRMFYGTAHIGHVVEVFAGVEPTSNLTAMFDVFGSLLLITYEGSVFPLWWLKTVSGS